MKKTLDGSFQYTPSYKTDLKKTFERIRRSQRKESGQTEPTPVTSSNIASLVRKSAAKRS
jgi:hypothetical protein